ncbi:MAG TPA: hypothetical protein VF037_05000 [Gemmatimonadales bacterium]
MLRGADVVRARQRRPLPSLKQQYQEYVLERIETYKNSIGRTRLLDLANEAVAEMQDSHEGQFLLTEVLAQEAVDRLIVRRLKLPPFGRWKQQYTRLRKAQREPTHWSLEPDSALAALLPRLEPEDMTLVVGSGVAGAAYLLAAYDTTLTFIAPDIGVVERVEAGLADEGLASSADCYFVQPGCWLPAFAAPFDLVVLDAGTLGDIDAATRSGFLAELQGLTSPAGVHVILPSADGLAPEAFLGDYCGWCRDEVARSRRRGAARRSPGVVLTAPALDLGQPAEAQR